MRLPAKRPYKEGWSIDEAFKELGRLAGPKLDSDCVQALVRTRPKVEEIKERFKEDLYA